MSTVEADTVRESIIAAFRNADAEIPRKVYRRRGPKPQPGAGEVSGEDLIKCLRRMPEKDQNMYMKRHWGKKFMAQGQFTEQEAEQFRKECGSEDFWKKLLADWQEKYPETKDIKVPTWEL